MAERTSRIVLWVVVLLVECHVASAACDLLGGGFVIDLVVYAAVILGGDALVSLVLSRVTGQPFEAIWNDWLNPFRPE